MGTACSSIEKGSCASVDDAKEKGDVTKNKSKGPKGEEDGPSPRSPKRNSHTDASAPKRNSHSEGEQRKKTDMARYERNLRKIQKVALEVVGEINHFNAFLKRNFKDTAEAFTKIACSDTVAAIEMIAFTDGLDAKGFTGDAHKVFYGLCDDQAWGTHHVITREAFAKRLNSLGTPFMQVVRQACIRDRSKIKKKVAEVLMAKNRDPEMVEAFRKFIEPRFLTPGKCFDAIAGDDGTIDLDEFVAWVSGLNFQGDASKVFHNLCDTDGYITRLAFTNVLLSTVSDKENENPQDADSDSGKKGNAKPSTLKQDEDPESSVLPQAKRKGKKKYTRDIELDISKKNDEDPESVVLDAAKRKDKKKTTKDMTEARNSITSKIDNDEEDGSPRSPKTPVRRSIGRSKSQTAIDGEEGSPRSPKTPVRRSMSRSKSQIAIDGEDASPRSPKALFRRSLSRVKSQTAIDGEEGSPRSPKTPVRRSMSRSKSQTAIDGEDASPRSPKALVRRSLSKGKSQTALDGEDDSPRSPKASRRRATTCGVSVTIDGSSVGSTKRRNTAPSS